MIHVTPYAGKWDFPGISSRASIKPHHRSAVGQSEFVHKLCFKKSFGIMSAYDQDGGASNRSTQGLAGGPAKPPPHARSLTMRRTTMASTTTPTMSAWSCARASLERGHLGSKGLYGVRRPSTFKSGRCRHRRSTGELLPKAAGSTGRELPGECSPLGRITMPGRCLQRA